MKNLSIILIIVLTVALICYYFLTDNNIEVTAISICSVLIGGIVSAVLLNKKNND